MSYGKPSDTVWELILNEEGKKESTKVLRVIIIYHTIKKTKQNNNNKNTRKKNLLSYFSGNYDNFTLPNLIALCVPCKLLSNTEKTQKFLEQSSCIIPWG